MPVKAGQIVIDITAGTGKFVVDMEAAKAKIREFGSAGVSEAKATRAAFKALEGQMFENKRAAEQFAEKLLGAGAVAKVAFPLVGGLAFAGMLGELGHKVHDFFKEMKEAPEKIHNAFRALGEPLRLTNDQLQVANDRLENDIAKLEGKRQNTLKLALDEARVAADKLADSLDKDLASVNKLVKENEIGRWKGLWAAFTGDLKAEFGGETGHEGFIGRINEITDEGNEKIRAAKDLKAKDAAQVELNTRLLAAYREEIGKVNGMLAESQRLQQLHERPKLPTFLPQAGISSPGETATDQTARLAMLRGVLRQLRYEMDSISLQATNEGLTGRKETLTAATENAQLNRPFQDRMKALNVQLEAVKAKFEAIGKPEAAQIMARAYGEAQKAIEEVNRTLEKHHTALTDDQKAQITQIEQSIASTEADAAWREHLEATNTSITARIRSQQLLTDAIGKGYEATKRANVETQLMAALGAHYGDAAWMQSHQANVAGLRTRFGQEYDTRYGQQVAAAVQKLHEQIELEKNLAAVQAQGADAVRAVALAYRLRELVAQGATREQIRAEIELFNATRANASAEAVANINAKIAATEKLTAKIFEGAEAQRKAALEAKYAEMARGGATKEEIAAERRLDTAEHQRSITEEAGKAVTAYRDQLEHLNQIVAAIQREKKERGDTLEIGIALRDLENERLRLAVQQELRLRGLRNGVRAFFLEMQQDATSAANVVYDTLSSAIDRVSDQFAKVLTGQRSSVAETFRGLAEEGIKAGYKALLQKGLGRLGEIFGIHAPGKPDGSAVSPFHVLVDNAMGVSPNTSMPAVRLAGMSNLANIADAGKNTLFAWLSTLSASGSSAAGGYASSSVSYLAGGGDVDPGRAYVVGDGGEPELFTPRSAGTITPFSKMGGSFTYKIDARGSELGVEHRIARAIQEAHDSAVNQGAQATAERGRRTPQRGS